MEAGCGNAVVSVPNGAPSLQTKDYSSSLNYLESASELLESASEVILAVDGDEPGQKLESELARRIGIEKCKKVTWPEGCKDANDVLITYGDEALQKCIADAKPFPIDGLFTADDMKAELKHLFEHGEKKGVSTGWDNVDTLYTVRPKEWTVVTGVPSHGKTSWLNALLINIAKTEGWRFGMYSPENQPVHNHIAVLMQLYSGIPFEEGWGAPKMTESEFLEAEQFVKKHFTFILPSDEDNHSIDNVLRLARASVLRHGINGLVIDPWNELDHTRESGMSETEHINWCLTKIRRFARKYSVHVWVVAHPQKMYRDSGGTYPMPTLYDISGSAHFRNKADNGIVIHRPNFMDFSAAVTVSVQKVRFKAVGHAGETSLYFNGRTGRYSE
jgi:twinkle protein